MLVHTELNEISSSETSESFGADNSDIKFENLQYIYITEAFNYILMYIGGVVLKHLRQALKCD